MGTWGTSINGNDTAHDLRMEYSAAFYKYEPHEAIQKIDDYVRSKMFDESDEEEWCDYIYSLADFMWNKGILTDEVREQAIHLIDTGVGLGLWEEAGAKTFEKRKSVLAEFRKKLNTPMPPKKKIKPNAYTERIFENGDVIAIRLQTAGKPYTENAVKPISEDAFRACDGKYVLMQLIDCYASWSSSIAPEVKDYWAFFRLFDGVYDAVPKEIDIKELKPAKIQSWGKSSSCFTCESSMFHFKRRKYQIVAREPIKESDCEKSNINIFFGVNKPWCNPDSIILSAMGN